MCRPQEHFDTFLHILDLNFLQDLPWKFARIEKFRFFIAKPDNQCTGAVSSYRIENKTIVARPFPERPIQISNILSICLEIT